MGRLRTFALCVATFVVAGVVAAASLFPGVQGWRVLAHAAPAQPAAAHATPAAAVTLARAILPEPRFIAGMNALAASLGLRQTHFTNPWGADDAGHQASASDLAVAAAYLDAHFPTLAAIAGTQAIDIPATASHK